MPIETDNGSMLTYEDYIEIPEDGKRHEIIEGTQFVSASPIPRHQFVLGQLHARFLELQEGGRADVLLAPIDVHLSKVDVVVPDLIAIASNSRHLIGPVKIEGAPELVAEILSPSTARRDRGAKRALYEFAGVAEYWVIDPQHNTLSQLSRIEGRFEERLLRSGRVESTAFPGFGFELASIF